MARASRSVSRMSPRKKRRRRSSPNIWRTSYCFSSSREKTTMRCGSRCSRAYLRNAFPNDPVEPVTRIEDPLISDTIELPGGGQERHTSRKHNHDPGAFQGRWKRTTPVQLQFNPDWSCRSATCKKVGSLCPPHDLEHQ